MMRWNMKKYLTIEEIRNCRKIKQNGFIKLVWWGGYRRKKHHIRSENDNACCGCFSGL